MSDEATTAYNLTEDDRQLILRGMAELAATDPELVHRLTHAAYRLQGIVAFEEYSRVAKARWIQIPAVVQSKGDS